MSVICMPVQTAIGGTLGDGQTENWLYAITPIEHLEELLPRLTLTCFSVNNPMGRSIRHS